MEIEEKKIGEVTVLRLAGSLMGGPEAVALNETLNRLLDEGALKLVLDLHEVERINSSGLGILIRALTTYKTNGGALKLARVSPKVDNLLVMTRLNTILETFETVEAAVQSF